MYGNSLTRVAELQNMDVKKEERHDHVCSSGRG
jgi:hypothetical protein